MRSWRAVGRLTAVCCAGGRYIRCSRRRNRGPGGHRRVPRHGPRGTRRNLWLRRRAGRLVQRMRHHPGLLERGYRASNVVPRVWESTARRPLAGARRFRCGGGPGPRDGCAKFVGMSDYLTLSLLAALAAALLVGSMLFFAAMVAPMVFKVLDERHGRPFHPAPVPGVLSGHVRLRRGRRWGGGIRPADRRRRAGRRCARLPVRPADADAADQRHARSGTGGGGRGWPKRFQRLHGLSVWINGAQFLVGFVVLARLIVAA